MTISVTMNDKGILIHILHKLYNKTQCIFTVVTVETSLLLQDQIAIKAMSRQELKTSKKPLFFTKIMALILWNKLRIMY